MKKKYFTPDMEIVEIKTQMILAASVGINNTGISDPTELLAPGMDIPNLPGINIPGFDLPGMNMPQ